MRSVGSLNSDQLRVIIDHIVYYFLPVGILSDSSKVYTHMRSPKRDAKIPFWLELFEPRNRANLSTGMRRLFF